MTAITKGLRTRMTGTNHRNKSSSRGHLVCQLELVSQLPQIDFDQSSDNNTLNVIVQNHSTNENKRSSLRNRTVVSASNQKQSHDVHPLPRLNSKLAFIDLAGAERTTDASFGTTNGDGANINRSLLALKECFRAIDAQNSHVPFRDSTLTKVIREYLVPANSCTLMMVHVSPADKTIDSALNSLQYAHMVRSLRKRCLPLLARKPELAHPSELYEGRSENDILNSNNE